ncbi:biopolymer transporter ExbD [Thermocrinis sp.]|uniref:ExbD/TolR family protein n=1 Tax=Thermocrinis sp. TaxID=2024383 RepID=UPI002FDEEAF3
MRRRRLSFDERAYIDVVPLVDTLLAVFLFLAVLAFQSPITLLAVKLPFAQEGEKREVSQVLTVQVLKSGEYILEGQRRNPEEIKQVLGERKPERLVIQADEETPHKFVVRLMDIAKAQDVQEVLIATRKKL